MNLLCILRNITTLFCITQMMHGYECGIYSHLIKIDILIGSKLFCCGGGKYKVLRGGEGVMKVIFWLVV